MIPGLNYNELSWTIDLIAHVKQVASSSNRSIKDAGGQHTVAAEGGSLFPDVLLFGDASNAVILQGWELKMPDTPVDDHEFIDNARRKAIALGLDSFLLWNVSYAHLYVRTLDTEEFRRREVWDDLSHISDRTSVQQYTQGWKNLASKIVSYMNDLFDRGGLEGRQFIDAYRSGGVTSLLMENTAGVADALREAALQDSRLKAEITLWWNRHRNEYIRNQTPYYALAQANLSNWIGKFIFAHVIQGRDINAQLVMQIDPQAMPEQALEIFRTLSETCNFWTIFADDIGLSVLPTSTWRQLNELNSLLTDLRVGSIDQHQLSLLLEAMVDEPVQKFRGQYATPRSLANLLVGLSVNNILDDRILDPCCGSGTIARAALEQKLNAGVDPEDASKTIFAGDLDHQAIQIATFALANPSLMSLPLRLFQRDAFLLDPSESIEFRDPNDGSPFAERIGRFNSIISNLPFVSQSGRKHYSDSISQISQSLAGSPVSLPGNSDIAAYLPFAFHTLLEDGGRLAIIITNAWLGTAWGDAFWRLIGDYYNVRYVITSGAGRWFQNSKVVTNILVMDRRDTLNQDDDSVAYVVLKHPLQSMKQEDISLTVAQILLQHTQDDAMTIRQVSKATLERFKAFGLGGNAQFVNCDWILDLPLIPLHNVLEIRRGERRGWDKMFYPDEGHGIEEEYIQPVLKSPQEITEYIASPQSEAFSCSLTIHELESLNHRGALNWISRFQHSVNGTGRPLPEVLARHGRHWYEMTADNLGHLVMPINYGNRLYVARLDHPAFVNQRLIRMNVVDSETDLELLHALLNSAISLFMIEGMGFGRGSGALDLSKDRIEKYMHILDFGRLNVGQIHSIKNSFAPLLQREILDVADELDRQDRQDFDDAAISAFNLQISRDTIYDGLLSLVTIRQTALDTYD